MRRHTAHFWNVLKHKYLVFIAGWLLGVPLLQLIFHDWHKFTPAEWLPYARAFYHPNGDKKYDPDERFALASNSHQKRAKHHWQWWCHMKPDGNIECLEMKDRHRREMLADWTAMSWARGKTDALEWYTENRYKIQLHDKTRRWVDVQLGYREDHAPKDIIEFMTEAFKLSNSATKVREDAMFIFCNDGNSER